MRPKNAMVFDPRGYRQIDMQSMSAWLVARGNKLHLDIDILKVFRYTFCKWYKNP